MIFKQVTIFMEVWNGLLEWWTGLLLEIMHLGFFNHVNHVIGNAAT